MSEGAVFVTRGRANLAAANLESQRRASTTVEPVMQYGELKGYAVYYMGHTQVGGRPARVTEREVREMDL